ncbi:hypothetical protein [Stutzerimonas stutzeri]|uniref:hypothetical protein n=1 Tax=Stutzerimonas stutzeri TaxID=316 RepID=UPI000D225AF2|nr:hypothetical protein [Stutzerimonas stutzeri]AVX13843.1 hypothetical protein CXB48_14115 [Stutzerimonas stutzeri]
MSKVLDSDGRIYEATQKVSPGAAKAYEQACQPAEAEGVGKWSELKKLAEKATPGPWWVDSHGHRVSTEDGMQTVFIAADKMGPATRHPETGNLSHWPNDWDASYIVNASPDKVLELIAALSAVTAERDRLRKDRDDCVEACVHYAGKLGEVMAERDQIRAELDELRKDAERFRHIERDCDSGMRGIYGDDWVEVIDGYIAEYAAMAAKEA